MILYLIVGMVSLIYAKVILLRDFLNHVEFYIIHISSLKILEAFILLLKSLDQFYTGECICDKRIIITVLKFINN